jgi:hypothetical protein
MKTQEETPMDEITLTEMLKEVFLHNKQMQDFMVMQKEKLDEKDQIIEISKKQTERLINSFETKFSNIQVQAPKPDLSAVNQILASSLLTINQTIEKGPKPVTKQIKFQIFPEQMRSPEYYKIMVWGILGFVFLIMVYLLLNKVIK